MEKRILGELEWNLTVPTPYVFLVRFIKASVPDQLVRISFLPCYTYILPAWWCPWSGIGLDWIATVGARFGSAQPPKWGASGNPIQPLWYTMFFKRKKVTEAWTGNKLGHSLTNCYINQLCIGSNFGFGFVQMENMVHFLAELGIMNYATIIYCPSMLAASAVYAARCTLNKSPVWNDTLKLHTGFSEAQVM